MFSNTWYQLDLYRYDDDDCDNDDIGAVDSWWVIECDCWCDTDDDDDDIKQVYAIIYKLHTLTSLKPSHLCYINF